MKLALTLAWQELTHNRRFSLFFLLNLSLGLTGFVTLESFKTALQNAIDAKSKNILAADLTVSARREFTPQENAIIDRLTKVKIAESRFSEFYSMVAFPGLSRLVQVKAIDERFPFYGKVQLRRQGWSQPLASQALQQKPLAWIYPELSGEGLLSLGSQLKLGEESFRVEDIVEDDDAAVSEVFRLAPRIYIGAAKLSATQLIQRGSTVTYTRLYKMPESTDVEALAKELDKELVDPGVRVGSPRRATVQIARSAKYLGDYLGLVALVAFFLSALGGTYLFRNYLAKRLAGIAILMSLGLKARSAQTIYFLQLVILSALAALPAAVSSLVLLPLLTRIFKIFLPFTLSAQVNWLSLLLGACLGTLGSLLLCLPTIQNLKTLSSSDLFREGAAPTLHFKLKSLFAYLPALTFFWGLSVGLSKSWLVGSVFFGSLMASVGLLVAFGFGLLQIGSRNFSKLAFPFRMALRNLSRNRLASVSCFLAISLAAVLINLVVQTQAGLRREISSASLSKAPTFFLFDIQEDQIEALKQKMQQEGGELAYLSPNIRARIDKVNGVAFEKDTDVQVASTREQEEQRNFRNRGVNLTVRDGLLDSEKIVAGQYLSQAARPNHLAPISLEKEFARQLKLKLGDRIDFDIQGVTVSSQVTSIRKVSWVSFEPNFLIEFPPGNLEDAPKTFLAGVFVNKDRALAVQNHIVAAFPNISIIEVSRVLKRVSEIIDQMALALIFMAILSLFSRAVVLFSIARHESFIRRFDVALLKVIGATLPQVLAITRWEFGAIGFSAGLFGTLVSYVMTYVLAYFVFDQVWRFSLVLPVAILSAITVFSILVTELAIRRTLQQSPRALLQMGK